MLWCQRGALQQFLLTLIYKLFKALSFHELFYPPSVKLKHPLRGKRVEGTQLKTTHLVLSYFKTYHPLRHNFHYELIMN